MFKNFSSKNQLMYLPIPTLLWSEIHCSFFVYLTRNLTFNLHASPQQPNLKIFIAASHIVST